MILTLFFAFAERRYLNEGRKEAQESKYTAGFLSRVMESIPDRLGVIFFVYPQLYRLVVAEWSKFDHIYKFEHC